MITHIRRQTERLELDHLSLRFFSPPSSKCLVLLIGTWFFHLHSVHSSLRTSFLVVLAFFLRMAWTDLRIPAACGRTYDDPGPAWTRRTSCTGSPEGLVGQALGVGAVRP